MTRLRYLVVTLAATLVVACGASEPAAPVNEDEAVTPPPDTGVGTILRVDARVDALVPPDARIEKLAEGFSFIEGPVWIRSESRLLFSDVRGNEIYQWTEADGASAFIDPVFEGDRTGRRSVSSNGLTLDGEGRLIICEHGNRRISRLEADGTRSVVVERFEGGSSTARMMPSTHRAARSISRTRPTASRGSKSRRCASSTSTASTG